MLAAPMAALLALVWCGRWREGALMTAAALVPWGGFTLAMQVATGGEYFRHTVIYNANVFYWRDLWTWWNHLLMFGLWKILAMVAGLVVLLLAYILPSEKATEADRPAGAALVVPLAVGYLAFAALSAVGIAKVGSAPNYLLELQAAMAMVIALAIGEVMHGLRHPWVTRSAGGVMVLLVSCHWIAIALVTAVTFGDGTSAAKTGFYSRAPGERDLELGMRVQMRVADAPDAPLLSEEAIFQLLEGRPLWFEPFIMTQLTKEGHWDETPFVEMLRDGHFALLILNQDIRNEDQYFPAFTPAMRAAIRDAYEFEQVIGGRYWVFVPKGEALPEMDGVIVEKSMDAEEQWNGRHWDFSPLSMPDVAERYDSVCRVIG
jgi:hypothetical protein